MVVVVVNMMVARVKCTRLLALIAAKRAKFLSSPLAIVPFIARIVSPSAREAAAN